MADGRGFSSSRAGTGHDIREKALVKSFMDILLLLVIASLAVLVIMNPKGFASAVSSVGGYTLSQTAMFTGSSYNTGGYAIQGSKQ